ncbi:hypothetical protein HDU82_007273 [Entophlyctis luteolus]|nr:hypothetical protein HDU82_007273 [Entophlyctis luteolus]
MERPVSTAASKPGKVLAACNKCRGSSWLHGSVAAPFSGLDNASKVDGVAVAFSPKPHCAECVKCSTCTNGKVLVVAATASSLSLSAHPGTPAAQQQQQPAHNPKTTLVKKRVTPVDTVGGAGSDSSCGGTQKLMDVVSLATLHTPSAVAAVSMSRISSRGAGSGLRIANGDDDAAEGDGHHDDSSSSDQETSAKQGHGTTAGSIGTTRRNANVRRRVAVMNASLESLSPTSPGGGGDQVPYMRSSSPNSLSGLDKQAASKSSSKDTVTQSTSSTTSQSSITQQKKAAFYGVTTDDGNVGGVQHPAVNILSMGSGVLTRKMTTIAAADAAKAATVKSTPGEFKLKDSILSDSTHMIGDSMMDRDDFPDLVDLSTMFSSKSFAEERPPNDEIKYRILENFDDGRLATVTYATGPSGAEYINSGDLESLVDALIFPLNQDNSYTEVFLATYRYLMPANELLTSLIEWYNVELDPETATPVQESYFKQRKKQFRGRAAKVLLTWIKNHWHDFHMDKELLDELSEFVGDLAEVSFGDSQRMTQAIREQRLSWYMTQYIPPFSSKRAPITEAVKPWGLLWEPDAFAAQLTLIDHHYFKQIRPDTYLCLLQRSVDKKKVAGDDAVKVLMDYVGYFRLVSSYTASLIYKEDTMKKRAKAIKRFIKIAKECRDLNNFNTAFAITHGLKRRLVAKMASAWEAVSSKHLETFRELEAAMDPKGGFANFWAELKTCVAPLIPFFAAYMHDLLEIHETEPVFVRDLPSDLAKGYKIASTDGGDSDIINFSKFYHLYSVVAEIELWRSYSYNSVLPEAAAAANDPKGDTCAVVLNHMKDWKVVEDSILDL